MKNNRGMTLLEMMSAAVIVFVLSSVAYPAYVKRVKLSRESEAKFILAQIRAAQLRYQANYPAGFADNLNKLDVTVTGKYFSYSITSASASDFRAIASTGVLMSPSGELAYIGCAFSINRVGTLRCENSECVSCGWSDAPTDTTGGNISPPVPPTLPPVTPPGTTLPPVTPPGPPGAGTDSDPTTY